MNRTEWVCLCAPCAIGAIMNRPSHINVWRVRCGKHERQFYTDYHAEQYASALRRHPPLADMPVTVQTMRLPNDALTRMTVTP